MPTYEYQCKKCGQVTEVFQSITAPALRRTFCETCGAERAVRRLIGTGGGLIFKGSGFYQTDYRSASYKDAAKADSDAPKATPDSKSDAKKPASAPNSGGTAQSEPKKDSTTRSSSKSKRRPSKS